MRATHQTLDTPVDNNCSIELFPIVGKYAKGERQEILLHIEHPDFLTAVRMSYGEALDLISQVENLIQRNGGAL